MGTATATAVAGVATLLATYPAAFSAVQWLGAAYLAGLKIGYWSGLDELEQNWRRKRDFMPEMASETRERLLERWARAVEVTRTFK